MCLFHREEKRSSARMPLWGQHRNGLQTLKKLVHLTTIMSPTQDGRHKLPVVTTDDADTAAEKFPHTRFVALGEATQEHLRGLFKELSGRSSSISRDKFASFLAQSQGEAVLPLEKDKYKFEEFLEVWSFQYEWDALKPASQEKDLSRSLSNYFISSSHNTYLLGNQLSSEASAAAYQSVLSKGCRCIEIDVWNRPPKSGSRTPHREKSPHDHHKRHLSNSSVATTVHEGLEAVTNMLAGRLVHNRSTSASQPGMLVPPQPARASSGSLDPNGITERIGRSLSRSSSRSRSRSQSAHLDLKQNQEPIVMHAHNLLKNDWSLGTYVGFRDVCIAIKESAFEDNPLPIIVSLEVHADPDQQEVMVQIMKEEWGDLLLDQPYQGCDPRLGLPRLEELQKKILIKVKKAPSRTNVPNGTSSSLGVSLSLFEENGTAGPEDDRTVVRAKKVKICDSLGKLAIYTHSEHFESFDDRSAKLPSHIFSLDENDISALNQTKHLELFRHNRTFFMRAYPSARHMDSSNPDPSKCWRKGVQMVALNWQTLDEAMMLNSAMFEGENGWVLKPPGYRSSDDSTCQANTGLHRTLDLKVTVLAGQHIPVPSIKKEVTPGTGVGGRAYVGFRPCVKCDLHVEKLADRCEKLTEAVKVKEDQLKQKTTSRETDHPDWGPKGTTMEFRAVPHVVEELSFVRFRIEDENTKFYHDIAKQALARNYNLAGWACIRLDRLRQGYRFISLMDAHGRPTEGKLLVKIEKTVR